MSEPILDELIHASLQQSPELHVHMLAQACIRRDQRIAELEAQRGRKVVLPPIPTWEEIEEKVNRGERRTALEKFIQDHDWHKTDTMFRDGLEDVFDELRANIRTQQATATP